jgi:hypothetical protein
MFHKKARRAIIFIAYQHLSPLVGDSRPFLPHQPATCSANSQPTSAGDLLLTEVRQTQVMFNQLLPDVQKKHSDFGFSLRQNASASYCSFPLASRRGLLSRPACDGDIAW